MGPGQASPSRSPAVRPSRGIWFPAALVLASLPAGTAHPAAAQETDSVRIDEWEVPWTDTRPRDPFAAESGLVWFVGQTGDYIATLDPRSGTFQRWDLEPGTGPHNLIVSRGGTVWIAGNRTTELVRFESVAESFTHVPMPDPAARDPHTLVFAPDSTIWFSVQHGNRVGHFDPSAPPGRAIRIADVPTPTSRPYGIVVDRSGRPWFTEFAAARIGTVDPATLEVAEYVLPRPETRPRRLQLTDDGAVWYVDFAGGMLGRLDPADGAVREWPVPGGADARPYGMAVDRDDRLWFVETGLEPNRLVGFDPGEERFVSMTAIPSGGGSVRHMHYDAATGAIWFGTDAGTIGRAVVGRPAGSD